MKTGNRIKKAIAGSLAGIMLLSMASVAAFADTAASATTTSSALDLALTLDEVIALTVENDLTASQQADKLADAEEDYQDALNDAADQDWAYSTADQLNALWISYLYTPYEKQVAIERLKRDQAEYLKTLEISTISTYIDYSQLVDALNQANLDLVSAQTTYNQQAKQYELGMITETDLKGYDIQLKQAELSVFKAENSLEQARIKLNVQIGYPIDSPIVLTTAVDVTTTVDYDIEVLTRTIEDYDLTITAAEETLIDLNKKFEVVKDHMNSRKNESSAATVLISALPAPAMYQDTLDDIDDQEETLADTINDEKINLRIDYNNLKSSEISANIAKLNYDAAVRSYNVATVKYNLGMITAFDLQTAKDTMKSNYDSWISAQNSLYIQDLEFQQFLGVYGSAE